jgi:multidrug efflux pump
MNAWIANITRRPVAVGVVYGLLFIGGVVSGIRLPLESGPATDLPLLEVSTSWEHFSPETMEQMITAPLEEIAGRVEGVKRISSVSEEGRSTIRIALDAGTNIDLARLHLKELLSGFAETFPEELPALTMQISFPGQPRDPDGFLRYSLAGDLSAAELRGYAMNAIVPDLLLLEGIRSVELFGGAEPEIEIGVLPDRMAAFGVGPEDVTRALEGAASEVRTSTPGLGGIRSSVSISADLTSPDDLRRLVVGVTPGGEPVRLADIAGIQESDALSEVVYRVNGMPAVAIDLVPEPGTDIIHVSEEVKTLLHDHHERLPLGLSIVSESDPSDTGRREQRRFSVVLLFSILCIMAVLHVFLRDLRATIVAVCSIVVSLALAFFALFCLRVSLHLSTLGAIILSFVRVADTITILLNRITFHNSLKGSAEVQRAMTEIARPLSVSTIVTIGILLIPAVLFRTVEPRLSEYAITLGILHASSLLVSLTFVPTIAVAMSTSRRPQAHATSCQSFCTTMYQVILRKLMRIRWVVVGLSIWGVGIPLWLIPDHLPPDTSFAILYNRILDARWTGILREYLYPILGGSSYVFAARAAHEERADSRGSTSILVRITMPPGTDPHIYERIAIGIEDVVDGYREHLENTETIVTGDGAFVHFRVSDSASTTSIPHEIRELLTRSAGKTGGAEIRVYGFGAGFARTATLVPSFLVEVRGYTYAKVKEITAAFRTKVGSNPRIMDEEIGGVGGIQRHTEIAAVPDRESLSRFGITVNEAIHCLGMYAGTGVTYDRIRINGRARRLRVIQAGHHVFSTQNLHRAILATGSGRVLPLRTFFSFSGQPTPGQITRENQEYIRWVRCEYKGPYEEGRRILQRATASVPLPPGYDVRIAIPTAMNIVEDERIFLRWLWMTVAIVFMASAAYFDSFPKAAMVITGILISLTGPFLVLGLSSLHIGQNVYAVSLLLIGVAMTHAFLGIDCVAAGTRTKGLTVCAMIEAWSSRFQGMLMSASTALAGIVPFLWIADGDTQWYSAGWGFAGCLIASFVVNLVVLPVSYTLMVGIPVGRKSCG